jgi:hypothetical protein
MDHNSRLAKAKKAKKLATSTNMKVGVMVFA